jgi:hypothetical protein
MSTDNGSGGIIEAGWQELLGKLPEMTPQTTEALRSLFFAGAHHYRTMVKTLFELEDGDERFQLFVAIANEIQRWEREDAAPEALLRRTTI